MMSQSKDPRNTPGPDIDPSDAFLDALTERSVAESKANLASGGRVLESVFDDPTVLAALDRVQSGTAPKEILMKHQMSGAEDAHTRWFVDEEQKTITIEQETHMGKPFISTSLLTSLVLVVMHREGVIAYNDETRKSWTPVRTDYTVFVRLGALRLRAEVWQQKPFASATQSTIEFYPVTEA